MARSLRARPLRRRRPTAGQRLRADFLAGLVIVLPAGLTVMLVTRALDFLDDSITPFLPGWLGEQHILGIGLLLLLVLTTLVGALIKGYVGRRVVGAGEALLQGIPVVRPIYVGAKQIVETAIATRGTSFRQACLVEYPHRGIWTVGFIAGPATGEVRDRLVGEELVSVFLATAPNPITGIFFFVPRGAAVPLAMSAEEALKLVLSGGLAEPKPPGIRPGEPIGT
jgi:uncharacterized membrane protein